jgi:PAS domain S-box-containing protein
MKQAITTDRERLKKKRAEASVKLHRYALKGSRLYSKLLNETRNIAIVVNTSGLLICVNEVFVNQLGYDREDIIGSKYDTYMDSEFKDLTVAAFKYLNMTDSGKEKFINRYHTKDGKKVLLEWYGWERDGDLILSFARVIHENFQ